MHLINLLKYSDIMNRAERFARSRFFRRHVTVMIGKRWSTLPKLLIAGAMIQCTH